MIKKIFLASFAVVSLAASLPAQVTGKVVIVAGRPQVVNAMKRAVQLKEAGIEVQVIFEREGILPFLDLYGVLGTAGWKTKMTAFAAEDAVETSTSTVKGRTGQMTAKHPKLKLLDMSFRAPPAMRPLLDTMKLKQIPYTLCSMSAKQIFDVFNELKATGEPMSPNADVPVDLSPLIKLGYQVIVY